MVWSPESDGQPQVVAMTKVKLTKGTMRISRNYMYVVKTGGRYKDMNYVSELLGAETQCKEPKQAAVVLTVEVQG